MIKKKNLPFGTWPSRITPDLTSGLREFSELSWSGDGRLLWVERFSNISNLMAWDARSGEINKLSGDINVGGGILYGGGSFDVYRDQVIFLERETQQLYWINGWNSDFQPIKSSKKSKASPRISPFGTSLIYIESDGSKDSLRIMEYSGNQQSHPLTTANDFYNYPRWHTDGSWISWMSWEHPEMPWEKSSLYRLNLKDIEDPGDKPEYSYIQKSDDKICKLQPEFSPDGEYLAYISDQSGWWNIYLYHLSSESIQQLTDRSADHALPPWLQNQSFYGFSPDSKRIYTLRYQQGFGTLWQLDLDSQSENQIKLDPKYTWLESLAVDPNRDQVAIIASGSKTPPEIIITLPSGDHRVIRKSSQQELDSSLFVQPTPESLKVKKGDKIYGLYYPPHNPEYEFKGKPPLLIIIHSGPTRQKYAEFQPRTQFFTSRGYAVFEVNYRGSTGYGREYWEALEGQWGVLDVEDVYQAAKAISKDRLIDKNRIALLGSSSGGMTVLQLLVKYPQFFRAGISLYGVTDLMELIKDPPKFERYYHNWLVGDPVSATAEYKNRSPINSADKIRTPIAIFQGGKDSIVPQEQAELIVEALKKNGVPHEYHLYPDEGHGFKRLENVSDFYQKTETFLSKYLSHDKP